MVREAEKLFELVTQRPDRSLKRFKITCPFCSSQKITTGSSCFTSTFDPHHWADIHCLACSKKFVVEAKGGHVWYTGERGKVLRGFPNCFETYVYTCNKCSSDVVRKCLNKSDGEESNTISHYSQADGSFISDQFYRYECVSCKAFVCTDC